MQAVRGVLMEFLDDRSTVDGAYDDIGGVCRDQPVDVLAWGQQHRVPAAERCEVGDDRVDRVCTGDQHQTTATSELPGLSFYALVQIAVGDRLVSRQQGGCIAEPTQLAREVHKWTLCLVGLAGHAGNYKVCRS